MQTEKLTNEMIEKLRGEAGAAGDHSLYSICDGLLQPGTFGIGRSIVCESINKARAMDDSKPFVMVVPF